MYIFLHFFFQNPCPRWLVIFCDFQDLSGIDPVVMPSSHDMMTSETELIHWNLDA